jgi:acyl dehydratase
MLRNEEIRAGRRLWRREVDITPELVARYIEGTGDANPWYSGSSPFGGPVAPALILHSEVYHTIDWYLSLFGNLHAKQEWELYAPLLVGERAQTLATIVDRYVKRDREYVVNEVLVFTEDGRLSSRGRTHQSFLLSSPREGHVVDKEREKRPERRFEAVEAAPLEEISGRPRTVTLEMCRAFSPGKNYHNDREEARKLGFPDVVVQGMMTLCFLSEMMTERFGAGWYCGGRMNVNLVNVVWGGDTVQARGAVTDVRPEGALRRHELKVWCEKEDGTRVVVGSAGAVTEA